MPTDADEVRMFLAEAGYPNALVRDASQSGDSPSVILRPAGGDHEPVPLEAAQQALALWSSRQEMPDDWYYSTIHADGAATDWTPPPA